jgi:ATP-binding cassette, subfamily B, bacterial PglK
MKNEFSLIFLYFFKILNFAKKKRKIQIFLLFLLSLLSIIFEILSVGSLIPFIEILSNNPDQHNHSNFKIIENIKNKFFLDTDIVLLFMFIFILFIIISYILKILLIWFSSFLNHSIGHEINLEIYKKTVFKKYSYHTKTNSSRFIGNIEKSDRFKSAISYIFQLGISLIMIFGFLTFMIYIDSQILIILSILGILIYAFVYILLKKKMTTNSVVEAFEIDNRIKLLQETSTNIREIIISKLQNNFLYLFRFSDNNLKKISIKNILYTNLPGNLILMMATVILSFLLYYYHLKSGGLQANLAYLAAIIFLIQKMLPQLQFIYSSISKLKLHANAVKDVYDFLTSNYENIEVNKNSEGKISFQSSIQIENGNFSHLNDKKNIFENLNLKIKKNDFVLILGATGSGKSTLVDLLMGLINLKSGNLLIDGNKISDSNVDLWQKKISHIPQQSGFLDSSILENITFEKNFTNVDQERLKFVTKLSEIYEFIIKSPNGFQTLVGDKAIRLSGGERQRIALSRALYNNKEVLFLDESTNALNNEIEEKIFTNIFLEKYQKTIIAISHNENLAKYFNVILKVKNKKVEIIK